MTLSELRTYVATRRKDPTFRRWDSDQTDQDINLGCVAFCDEVPLASRFIAFVTGMAPGEYVPDEGVELDEVLTLQTQRGPLTRTSEDTLIATDATWQTRTGAPLRYIPNWKPGVVRLYPIPDGDLTDLYGRVTQIHPALTADGEEPIFQRTYHIAAAYWALAEGYAMGWETDDDRLEQKWRAKFFAEVRKAKGKTARDFSQAPINVKPAR